MPALSSIGRLPGRAGGLANEVVTTALDAMGAPYLWGGTDDNGFDCSGLIQYAYAEHGIIIPRVSRDQARHGEYIEPRVENLRPGDILGFAITRGRVSHVGLYVGSGQFIHSSSSGVTLSSLTETDGDSRWYQQRWVVARRMLN
jgi:cell wall-associated NlpC family hydrolase